MSQQQIQSSCRVARHLKVGSGPDRGDQARHPGPRDIPKPVIENTNGAAHTGLLGDWPGAVNSTCTLQPEPFGVQTGLLSSSFTFSPNSASVVDMSMSDFSTVLDGDSERINLSDAVINDSGMLVTPRPSPAGSQSTGSDEFADMCQPAAVGGWDFTWTNDSVYTSNYEQHGPIQRNPKENFIPASRLSESPTTLQLGSPILTLAAGTQFNGLGLVSSSELGKLGYNYDDKEWDASYQLQDQVPYGSTGAFTCTTGCADLTELGSWSASNPPVGAIGKESQKGPYPEEIISLAAQQGRNTDICRRSTGAAFVNYPLSNGSLCNGGWKRKADGESQDDRGDSKEKDCGASCYSALLRRLAQLEDSIAMNTNSLSVDFVLAAEQDTRALKERLFACPNCAPTFHTPLAPSDPEEFFELPPARKPQATRPSPPHSTIMLLALLADRVVMMLEDLLQHAAEPTNGLERALGTSWTIDSQLSPTGIQALPNHPPASSVDHDRFARSASDGSAVPQTNCELPIGNYVLDPYTKELAMKRILRVRMRRLENMLVDMESCVKDASTGCRRAKAGNGGNLRPALEDEHGGTVMTATRSIIADFPLRLESLQGRVQLEDEHCNT